MDWFREYTGKTVLLVEYLKFVPIATGDVKIKICRDKIYQFNKEGFISSV